VHDIHTPYEDVSVTGSFDCIPLLEVLVVDQLAALQLERGLAEAQHVDTHCAVLGLANRCREWLEVGGAARDVEPFGGLGNQRSMAPASTRMMLPV
jgi:hypothetical protein